MERLAAVGGVGDLDSVGVAVRAGRRPGHVDDTGGAVGDRVAGVAAAVGAGVHGHAAAAVALPVVAAEELAALADVVVPQVADVVVEEAAAGRHRGVVPARGLPLAVGARALRTDRAAGEREAAPGVGRVAAGVAVEVVLVDEVELCRRRRRLPGDRRPGRREGVDLGVAAGAERKRVLHPGGRLDLPERLPAVLGPPQIGSANPHAVGIERVHGEQAGPRSGCGVRVRAACHARRRRVGRCVEAGRRPGRHGAPSLPQIIFT